MKKWIMLIWLLTTAGIAQACDVCGCSAGGSSFGLLPNYHRHFMGIRYQYRSFLSEHHDAPGVFSTERYHSAEVWGRWVLGKRFQLFGQLPYNHYTQEQEGAMRSFDGLGDASLIAQVVVFNTGDSLGLSWRHGLQLGGGVKLPTGRSRAGEGSGDISPSLLPGTGSFDFPIQGLYTLRYGKWGANLEASYRINTANRDEYRFGNRLNGSLRVFYAPGKGKAIFMPNAGIQFERGVRPAIRVFGIPDRRTGPVRPGRVGSFFGEMGPGLYVPASFEPTSGGWLYPGQTALFDEPSIYFLTTKTFHTMKNTSVFFKALLIFGLATPLFLSSCDKEHEHNSAVIEIDEPLAGQVFEQGDTVFIHAHATGEADLHGYELTLTDLSTNAVLFSETAHEHGLTLHMESFWVNDIAATADVKLEVSVTLSHEGDELETEAVEFNCKS
ncbi:MAG: hypothetical protein IPG32_17290 [Saprospirales bacterium]|nr:hypothetical protein [Saprospirales bacterium]